MRPIFAAAAVAMAGVGLLTFEASPTEAAVFSVGPPFGSTGTSACMDVSGNSLGINPDGSVSPVPVIVFACHAGPNQQFQFAGPNPEFAETVPPGTTIYTESGQRCLDVEGVGTTNGTPLISFSCNGGVNQQFIYEFGQIMVYFNTRTLKCLDAGNGTSTVGPNGTQLIINDCNGSDNQQFQIK